MPVLDHLTEILLLDVGIQVPGFSSKKIIIKNGLFVLKRGQQAYWTYISSANITERRMSTMVTD